MADLLVVDDDVEMGDLLVDLLRDEGHEVRVARNGREGLALMHDRLPDLILLDVEMPVLTGPEVAYAMLLHDAGMEQVPIVLISAILGLPQVAATVGTPYFMAKPYDLRRLFALVEKALAERVPPHPTPRPSAHA